MQDRKKQVCLRLLAAVALAAWVAFIFSNSLRPSAASSAQSGGVQALLNALLARLGLGPLSEHAVRKLAHFVEFAVLGALLAVCRRLYTGRVLRHPAPPLLAALTVALCDETLQSITPGRDARVSDIWLDWSGAATGLLLAAACIALWQKAHKGGPDA